MAKYIEVDAVTYGDIIKCEWKSSYGLNHSIDLGNNIRCRAYAESIMLYHPTKADEPKATNIMINAINVRRLAAYLWAGRRNVHMSRRTVFAIIHTVRLMKNGELKAHEVIELK